MLVRVAIDLALDRLFDYEVPKELEKKLAVGQLLSVPFGHRTARGFAMEIVKGECKVEGARCKADGQRQFLLKPIDSIVDEEPFFSTRLLELVRALAAYTAAPVESVLKAAVPAAVVKPNARAKELYFIEPALAPAPVPMTARRQWLYDQIVRLGGGWMQQLCRELKTTTASLKELGRLGLVTIAPRQKRRDPLGNMR
ncbi:MAG: hypothetical protein J6Q49_06340, partial [Kiritimatiellae bacterium]|nr:hypothetical protein [Kiritimatiellia bacterium]